MSFFHFDLIEAGIVARPFVTIEDRRMTRIAGGNGEELAAVVLDGKDRQIVVAGAFELGGLAELGDIVGFVFAAIDGKVSPAVAPGKLCWREFAERLLDDSLNGALELIGVLVDQLLLLLIERVLVHRPEIAIDDGAAVRVRAVDSDLR